MRKIVTMAMLCTVATVGSAAQEPAAVEKQAAEANAIRAKLQVARVGVESRLTKNAPYSAEAVTESVQLLADGNRIVTKNTTHIFRDSEGRTRREQLNAAGTDVVSVNITDPSSGTTYALDPASRTAYRNGLFVATWNAMASTSVAPVGRGIDVTQTPDGAVVVTSRELERKAAAEGQAATEAKATAEIKARTATPSGGGGGMSGSFATFDGGGFLPAKIAEASGKTTQEDLGQQTIEGVSATGTRTTTEIPAGAIGNEQPIRIVSEQWFSPELQVLVLTKHSDPRTGETTYRLTGVVRAEQARSLFDLPPDYTLQESVIRRQQQ
jgi:hypothetical protein